MPDSYEIPKYESLKAFVNNVEFLRDRHEALLAEENEPSMHNLLLGRHSAFKWVAEVLRENAPAF
jgi:hypothetical protein